MNFGKESKSEEKRIGGRGGGGELGGGGGGGGEEGGGGSNRKNICIRLFFVLMLYIKFQVPGSSGSLVLTQTKGVTDRLGA